MAFNLNSLACVWRTGRLVRGTGRRLGCLFPQRNITSSSILFNTIPHHSVPSLLIPSPRDPEDNVIAAAIANEESRGFPDYCFYSVAERKLVKLNNVRSKSNIVIPDDAICVGSSHGWLAYVDPRDLVVFITNPLVSPVLPTIRLPSLKKLPRTIEEIQNPFAEWGQVPPGIDKLVMSSSPSSDNDDNCTVTIKPKFSGICLAFCKLGDSSWTALDTTGSVEDITYSSKHRLFYLQDYYNNLEAWNLCNPHSPRRINVKAKFINGLPDYPEFEKKLRQPGHMYPSDYMAMDSYSGDVLHLIRHSAPIAKDGTVIDWSNEDHQEKYNNGGRHPFSMMTLRFDVYRLNASKRWWDYVTDLGDGVIFVGFNHTFHLSARDFAPGVLIPNSIYFSVDTCHDSNDIGIYNMQDFTVKSIFPPHLHQFNNLDEAPRPPPMWFNPWNN